MAIDINIDEFKRFLELVSNKNGKGSLSPSNINQGIKQGFSDWYEDERSKYESSQNVSDNMSHFKVTANIEVPASGRIPVPDGTGKDRTGKKLPEYRHFSSMRSVYNVYSGTTDDDICPREPKPVNTREFIRYENDFDMIRDDQIGRRLNSALNFPSVVYPVVTNYGTEFEVWPKKGLDHVVLTYLREPNEPVWGYTLDRNGRPKYDSASSTNIDAPKKAFNDIAGCVLKYFGMNFREDQLIQYAMQMKQEYDK